MFMFKKIGLKPALVKNKNDLAKVCGLIIPGGESTTISKLLFEYGLGEEIIRRAEAKTLCVWGTCAGAILLAKKVSAPSPRTLGLMDAKIERNAYGGQIDSFEAYVSAPAVSAKPLHAVFIRAPVIKKVSRKVKILAEYGQNPVMIKWENLLASTFHPELTRDLSVHKYFAALAEQYETRQKLEKN